MRNIYLNFMNDEIVHPLIHNKTVIPTGLG